MATVKKKTAAPKKKAAAPKKKAAAPKKKAAVAPKKKSPPRGPSRIADVGAARGALSPIPFDIAPHFARVRAAVDALVATLKRHGALVKLGAPASVEAILTAERARGISLPNDFRALLTLHDGMSLHDRRFFATRDYVEDTQLTLHARAYLQSAADDGAAGIEECIPLASWGSRGEWLLYDPRGALRGGKPGHVVMQSVDRRPTKDLCDALGHLEKLASRGLGAS